MLVGCMVSLIPSATYGEAKPKPPRPRTPVIVNGFSNEPGQVVDMVVATIDGDPITGADLRAYAKANPSNQKAGTTLNGDDEVKRNLREMLLERLLMKEAESMGMNVTDEEVQQYFSEIRKQNNVDQKGFVRLLASQGLTLEEYSRQVRNDILRTRVVGARVRSKIHVDEQVVDQSLAARKESNTSIEGQIPIEEAIVPLSEDHGVSGQEAAIILSEVRRKVAEGQPFGQAAGEHFRSVGFVNVHDLRDEIRIAIAGLKPGELSDIVRTEEAYYLVKIGVKQTGNDSRERVRDELHEQQMREQLDRYLNEELPRKYHVEVKL